MKRNKVIVAFLILLFSFQLMPVKQVGSILYCNQLTEELPHSGDTGNNNPGNLDTSSKFISHFDYLHSLIIPALFTKDVRHFSDESFTSRNSDDITTPPPNNHV